MKSRALSLKSFLSLQFLMVSLIPVVLVMTLVSVFFLPYLSTQEALEQETLARAITSRIEGQLEGAKRELHHLALLLNQSDEHMDTLLVLDEVAELNPFYEAVYITDAAGIVVLAGLPEKFRDMRNNFIGLDMSRKAFFIDRNNTDQRKFSSTFLSAVSGRLSVGYVVELGGQTLVAEISIDKLPDLSQFLSTDSGQIVMILDGEGQLLAHPDSILNGQQLNLSNLGLVKDSLTKGEVSRPFEFLGESYFGSLVFAEKAGWLVVVSKPLDLYQSALKTIGQILLTTLLICIVVAIIVAQVIGGVFSRRFEAYMALAQAMTSGRYDLQPQDSKIAEIGALGRVIWGAGQQIKSREEELKAREQRYRALVEQSPMAIIEWDENLNLVQWNGVAEDILGFLDDESVGSVLGYLAQEENQQRLGEMAARFEKETSFIDEKPFKNKYGDAVICRSFNTVIKGDDGGLLGYLSLVEDITDQRRIEHEIKSLNSELEQRVADRTNALSNSNEQLKVALKNLRHTQAELVRADKLAALGGMVAGVSHELNTPIGNALMAITTLREYTHRFDVEYHAGSVKRSTFEGYLSNSQESEQLIEKNLNRAAELITSFKQVAVDQTSSQKRRFDLKQHVDEVLITLKPVLKGKPVVVECTIPDGIKLVSFPGPLGQVITNLINNALLHGLEGCKNGVISLSAEQSNETIVVIVIEDNGKGIPEEDIDKVFDPFFSTRLGEGGTGLGLHIVHNIVTGVLKGSIDLLSNNEGTRFTIRIPLSPT